jgi:hypothetical protein
VSLRLVTSKTNRPRVATAVDPSAGFAVRPVMACILLTLALTVRASSAEATTPPTARTPSVSPVTVTVPTGRTPQVTLPVPTVRTPTVRATPPITTPAATTPATPAPVTVAPAVAPATASTPSSSTAGAPARPVSATSPASNTPTPAATRHARMASRGAVAQPRLRNVVVSLSQCLSTLSPDSRRMLLLRAGIGPGQPDSPLAVARTMQISVASETIKEHAALLQLQTAARQRRCGSTPAWIHVPAQDRLVLVDAVLASAPESDSFSPASPATALPAWADAFRSGGAKLSFTLSAAKRALLSSWL